MPRVGRGRQPTSIAAILLAGERQVEHQQQTALRRHDDAQRAIDQRRPRGLSLALEVGRPRPRAPRSSANAAQLNGGSGRPAGRRRDRARPASLRHRRRARPPGRRPRSLRWLATARLRRPCLPRTRRRARLASCRAAVGERPTMGAISSNGRSNMSCSTKRDPLGRRQRLEHDEQRRDRPSRRARPRARDRPRARGRRRAAARTSSGSSRRDLRERRVSRQTRRPPWSASRRGCRCRLAVGAAEPQPGFLDGVVGLARRAQHAVGNPLQMVAVRLELLGQPFFFFHRSHSPIALRHSPDGRVAGRCDKGDDHAITDDQPRFRRSRGA